MDFTQSALSRNTLSARYALARNAGVSECVSDEQLSTELRENHRAISRAVKALLSVLANLGVPVQCRPFIEALVALSDGQVEFESEDYAIARQVFKDVTDERSRDSLKKKVQRWRKALIKWQELTGYTLVQISPGYKTGEETHKSSYRLVVLEMAAQVLRSPGRNMREAAFAALREMKALAPKVERATNRPRTDATSMRNRNIKAMLTFARNAFEQAATNGDDVLALKEAVKSNLDELAWQVISRDVFGDSTEKKEGTRAADEERARVPEASHSTPAGRDGCVPTLPSETESIQTLAIFESVDSVSFSVTILDEPSKTKALFEVVSGSYFRQFLSEYLRRNATKEQSFIVRPHGAPLIQLDDLNHERLARVKAFAFIVAETSPNNFQAWLRLADSDAPQTVNVRELLLRSIGADKGASGAMRWPGSINRKPGRNDFRVRLIQAVSGRCVTVAELEHAGLLKQSESPLRSPEAKSLKAASPSRRWPDYQRCLADFNGDRSRADWNFSLLSAGRGFSEMEISTKLRELSDKARIRRDRYAEVTAHKAMMAVKT